MNTIRQTLERTYAAAAFAEAGEHDTARHIAGITAVAQTAVQKITRFFDVHMSAASFAEAGCHDTACDLLGTKRPVSRPERETLDDFLQNVGLPKRHVRYGWATV